MSSSRRKERGAVAVMVAIMSVALITISAFAVDLSNGFVRKRDVQAQADFAALAGAPHLEGTKSAGDPAVLAVVDYLNKNQPQDDKGSTAVTAVQLVDGPAADPDKNTTQDFEKNGEVYFESPTRLRVISPEAQVNFGLAQVIGFEKVDVSADATVGIFSPGTTTMPVFAVSGCDQGPQTITDPANGHASPTGPDLWEGTDGVPDQNKATLDPSTTAVENPNPRRVDVNPATQTLTIRGNNLTAVTRLGFFKSGDGLTTAPPPIEIPGTSIQHTDNNRLSVALPIAGVTDHESLWWIRVWGPANGTAPDQWSSVRLSNGNLNTVPFRVGNPYLQCAGNSNEGNYGTLVLPRTDTANSTNDGWLPVNIATGLQEPLSLGIHPSSTSLLCDPSDASGDTIYSRTNAPITEAHLKPLTNCVDTDPGLPANSVSNGLISGANGEPGRLNTDTTPGCDPIGGDAERTVTLSGNPSTFKINNDILTCYFLNDTNTVADISNLADYTGDPVISAEIYNSPRFFWQPVLAGQPGNGASDHYTITDMRAAFLTEQPLTANRPNPQAAADNGVKISNGSVAEMKVVFFNHQYVETPVGGPVVDWMGGNMPKVVRLVD